MVKYFKFIAKIQIEADTQVEADEIMNNIKNEGEVPDGSIVDNTFNIKSWERFEQTIR